MYRNADEIEKLKKIKEDSDHETAMVLQQLKTLSESRDSMQRELVELRDIRDAALEVTEAIEIPQRREMSRSRWLGGFAGCLEPLRGLSPTLPTST